MLTELLLNYINQSEFLDQSKQELAGHTRESNFATQECDKILGEFG